MIDLGVEKQEKKKLVGGKKDDSVSTSAQQDRSHGHV